MQIFKYAFRSSHSYLYKRCELPIVDIPVYHQDNVVCTASMNPIGEFFLDLPDELATKLKINDGFIEPEWTDLDVAGYSEDFSVRDIRLRSLHVRDMPMYL